MLGYGLVAIVSCKVLQEQFRLYRFLECMLNTAVVMCKNMSVSAQCIRLTKKIQCIYCRAELNMKKITIRNFHYDIIYRSMRLIFTEAKRAQRAAT